MPKFDSEDTDSVPYGVCMQYSLLLKILQVWRNTIMACVMLWIHSVSHP